MPDVPFLSAEPGGTPQWQALYTTAKVNLRSGPTYAARPMAVIDRGLQVSPLRQQGEWYEVRVGAFEGWINGRYLAPAQGSSRAARW
ncbi:SH3 domain-containing protein [Ancylobacter sp. GSK1Z-4-2]|nr:SH3 domain-containing protein [Ancylobacter mangrovi]